MAAELLTGREATVLTEAGNTPRPAVLDLLRERFGISFGLWDGDTGELLFAPSDGPAGDVPYVAGLVQAAAGRSEVQFLAEEPPVLLISISLPMGKRSGSQVAVGVAVSGERIGGSLGDAARLLGVSENRLADWLVTQPKWSADSLERLGRSVCAELAAVVRAEEAERELDDLSESLAGTYEEISLLYGLTQNLRLTGSDTELAEITLEWLAECVHAESVVIQYLPVAAEGETTYQCRTQPVLLKHGQAAPTNEQFSRLIEHLDLSGKSGPYVANGSVTGQADWPAPEVRQLIVVPLTEGKTIFGWVMALNRRGGGEFGTVEASLCGSVAAILGIHSGNVDLYRRQAEFVAGVVRALSSAIDAKDPYTSGHSDRVARIAVRLGREMGVNAAALSTLYMGGLLHDIGKIGIDDRVLRKVTRLSSEEFKHIQQHPELGARILGDLKELSAIVPVVLHHHEQWDGEGYPAKLGGENIPLLARIAAVADAYDAMASDRPYRQGMPLERVEAIFREGAGKQWDAAVIEAYFRCREDILEIARQTRANLTLDLTRWVS